MDLLEAHRLLCHSTLGSRVVKKKKAGVQLVGHAGAHFGRGYLTHKKQPPPGTLEEAWAFSPRRRSMANCCAGGDFL